MVVTVCWLWVWAIAVTGGLLLALIGLQTGVAKLSKGLAGRASPLLGLQGSGHASAGQDGALDHFEVQATRPGVDGR